MRQIRNFNYWGLAQKQLASVKAQIPVPRWEMLQAKYKLFIYISDANSLVDVRKRIIVHLYFNEISLIFVRNNTLVEIIEQVPSGV